MQKNTSMSDLREFVAVTKFFQAYSSPLGANEIHECSKPVTPAMQREGAFLSGKNKRSFDLKSCCFNLTGVFLHNFCITVWKILSL